MLWEESGRRRMSEGRSLLGAVAAMGIGLLLTLLVAEGVTRLFYDPAPAKIRGLALKFSDFYRPDPELGWVPRADITGTYIRFPASFKTNSQGLRDREYELAKPAGTRRIVVIGDSHTWGYGVNNDEIYTEKLESLLADTEVVNLGVTAYSLWQEVGYFRRKGLTYEPDILIVGFTQNDVEQGANLRNIELANNPPEEDSQAAPERQGRSLQELIAQNSALYKFVSDRINTNKSLVKFFVGLGLKAPLADADGIDNNLKTALLDYPPALDEAFSAVQGKLLELKRLTDMEGVRLIVAAIPAKQAIEPITFQQSLAKSIFEVEDFDLDKPYRLLAEFAEASGIEFVNPVAAFRQRAASGEVLYLKRDVHLNAAGHDTLAQVLADYLDSAPQ